VTWNGTADIHLGTTLAGPDNVSGPNVAAYVPVPATDIVVASNISPRLWAMVPIARTDIQVSGDVQPISIAGLGSSLLELQGINLRPGQELTIDTDTLDVWVDGEKNVTYITTDSEFFQLLPGKNEIIIRDGEASRDLQVTAVWANRYL
jgi:hypothetical protein